ncbi:MAG: RHS repeat domain-containing protein, partial [Algisphaera sp.]
MGPYPATNPYSNQVTYSYHPDSTIATENITGIGGGPNGYTVTRGYDADNRLTSITHPDGSIT